MSNDPWWDKAQAANLNPSNSSEKKPTPQPETPSPASSQVGKWGYERLTPEEKKPKVATRPADWMQRVDPEDLERARVVIRRMREQRSLSTALPLRPPPPAKRSTDGKQKEIGDGTDAVAKLEAVAKLMTPHQIAAAENLTSGKSAPRETEQMVRDLNRAEEVQTMKPEELEEVIKEIERRNERRKEENARINKEESWPLILIGVVSSLGMWAMGAPVAMHVLGIGCLVGVYLMARRR